MADEKVITATEASRAFSDVLHRVCYGGESFVIKKGQRLMARITPVEMAVTEVAASALSAEEKLPDNVTPEEAEYYRSVIEQIRSAAPEVCE